MRGLGRAQEGRSRAEDSSGPLPRVREDRGPSAALAWLRTMLACEKAAGVVRGKDPEFRWQGEPGGVLVAP